MSELKLSERLRQLAAEETANWLGETEPDSYWPGGKVEAYEHACRLVLALESTNAALTKRVAELENENARVRSKLVDAEHGKDFAERGWRTVLQELEKAEKQLAWTPVSAELPTEPGMYAFVNVEADYFTLFELDPVCGWVRHEHQERVQLTDITDNWRAFRRIELPKGGES